LKINKINDILLGEKKAGTDLCYCTCNEGMCAQVVGAAECGAQLSGGKKTDEGAELG